MEKGIRAGENEFTIMCVYVGVNFLGGCINL